MKKSEIRAIFQPFFVETRIAFAFLEHAYGYQRLSEEVNTSHPFDWAGTSRYTRARVGVEIHWAYVESSINVHFVALLQPGSFQDGSFYPHIRPDLPRKIALDSLAGMLGHGDDPDFVLSEYPSLPIPPVDPALSRRADARALKQWMIATDSADQRRRHLIETDLAGILAGLARATQTYATAILEGETSIFPAVMDYFEAETRRHGYDLPFT
jgi:hypothetical protein